MPEAAMTPPSALDLARINVANRPTLRAFEQAHDIAVNAGDMEAASQILAEATMRWGSATVFGSSRLAKSNSEGWEGAATSINEREERHHDHA